VHAAARFGNCYLYASKTHGDPVTAIYEFIVAATAELGSTKYGHWTSNLVPKINAM
jgi:hypothetical protein